MLQARNIAEAQIELFESVLLGVFEDFEGVMEAPEVGIWGPLR